LPASAFIEFLKYQLPYKRLSNSALRILSKSFAERKGTGAHIAIVCFHTTTAWWDGYQPDGTAGAEEAVIHLARQLSAMGWKVTVYNNCIHRRLIGLVTYEPSWKFNPWSHRDITILWRSARLLQERLPSLTYLWLHNVQRLEEFPQSFIENVDRVVFLSKFHRNTLLEVPEDKALIIGNGISPSEIPETHDVTTVRDRLRCVYASAPDRGLECLLALWPAILRRVPGATLQVYYGWTDWDFWTLRDPSRFSLKQRILRLLDQPGVLAKNVRIDPLQLWLQFRSAGLWLYPTECEETSCINGMKAQAAGAIPVVTDVGAISETIRWGTKIKCRNIYSDAMGQAQFIEAVEAQLMSPNEDDRAQMIEWARRQLDWSKAAEVWRHEFQATGSRV
jgi:glycosyltransferase involved in cell wall biosynthesis